MHIIHAEPTDCPIVESTTRSLLDSLAAKNGPHIQDTAIPDARWALTHLQEDDVTPLPADIEDMDIPGGPKGTISLRIVRPPGSTSPLPAVMYFHGGGWVLGDSVTHDALIRSIANGAHAAVVFVNYSRSPEAQYPIAIEEAYAATSWVAANGASIRVDAARLAVAGDSAGGNMAAAVTLMAKLRGGPAITCQVLFYPVTDADFGTASYEQFDNGYHLTRDAMKWFWNNYAPELAVRTQPTASPLRAKLEQLRGLPSALIITGECDVLRDEGEAYARKLVLAGVAVTAVRFLGTIHDFVMLRPLARTASAHAALALASESLRAAFAVR